MKPEQPELDIIRSFYECTMQMVEKLPYSSNDNEITAIAVPEEMHEQYRKKFELHAQYEQCFKAIKRYVLSHIEDTGEDPISINIPLSLHPLLKARGSNKWDIDSRIEVFESFRSYITNECIKPELLQEMSDQCGFPVLLMSLSEDEDYYKNKGYSIHMNVYTRSGDFDGSN